METSLIQPIEYLEEMIAKTGYRIVRDLYTEKLPECVDVRGSAIAQQDIKQAGTRLKVELIMLLVN